MKNKKKILKIRPFNMANFSGGSGYLIFSLFYQAFALIPGTLIVWLLTLVKLPKDEEGKIIPEKAKKRFLAVTIPITVIFIIGATIFAIYCCEGYGDLKVYFPLILFIGIVPAISSFFILKFFHEIVTEKNASRPFSIVFSVISIIIALSIIFGISIGVNSILESYEYERDTARFEAEIAEMEGLDDYSELDDYGELDDYSEQDDY